ncbi:hypothetical protein KAH55_13190, partial [bacterium]|nr:hypothetical protein [bacterium]
MKKSRILFEENSRVIYETDEDSRIIIEYTDILTVSGGKKIKIPGVAAFTKAFAENLYQYLEEYYLCTHFSDSISETELTVEKTRPVLLDAVLHNQMTAGLARRFAFDENMALRSPLIEFFWNGQLISLMHASAFGIIATNERRFLERTLSKINAVLKSYFTHRDYRLVQMRLNFGYSDNIMVLTGNFSLDSIVIQNLNNGEIFNAQYLIDNVKKTPGKLAEL